MPALLPTPAGRPSVAPSLLAADNNRLGPEVARLERLADWIHVDVMDGHFVPNLSFGPSVVADLTKTSKLAMDVHLMVEKPWRMFEPFVKAGAGSLTVHLEACKNPRKVLRDIRALGVKAGLSLKPKTPAAKIFPYLKDLDLVLVMTVEPGFGGQSFMSNMKSKVRAIRAEIDRNALPVWLQVDGGINKTTAGEAASWGADSFVAGNAIFKAPDPRGALKAIRKAVTL